tara:strand:+ start:1326 stop:1748 length:423 start_codon:yes stop_codon:yes gene_type:complete
MGEDLKIYYSKSYKKKWFIALAVISILYLLIVLMVDEPFLLDVLLALYLVIIVVSLQKPYLHIKGDRIRSGYNMSQTLSLSKLKGVFIEDGDYVFREKHKVLYINLDLVSLEDKKKVIRFLKENELLKSTYDAVQDLFKM